MTRRSNYRPWYQNLYVRRIIMVIGLPLFLLITILLYGIYGLPRLFSEYEQAWQPEKL
jgi:hypothetical protein